MPGLQRRNRIAERRAAGEVPTGLVIQLGCPEVVEMAGAADFDYAWIDCEHGSFDIETAVQMFRAADAVGITPLIRVPNQERSFIMRALDAGAMGVIVPNVETRVQAEQIVAAAKYRTGSDPGMRGACPGTRAAWHQATNWPEFTRWSNDQTAVWLIIESPVGVRNLEEILQVQGVDAIVLGSFDLAQAMGFDGNIAKAEVQRALSLMIDAARRHGLDVVANMFVLDEAELAAEGMKWVDAGASILCVGSDRRMFMHALKTRAGALSARALKSAPRRLPGIGAVDAELADALGAARSRVAR